MVLLGEWFCVRRELQDIPLSEYPVQERPPRAPFYLCVYRGRHNNSSACFGAQSTAA